MTPSALLSGSTTLTNNIISLDTLLFPPLNGLIKEGINHQKCKKDFIKQSVN